MDRIYIVDTECTYNPRHAAEAALSLPTATDVVVVEHKAGRYWHVSVGEKSLPVEQDAIDALAKRLQTIPPDERKCTIRLTG